MSSSSPQSSPAAVTVLGLGPMGQSLAGAFLAAGHPTTVWNRSPGRAGDLVERGAVEADSVTEAIERSTLVVVCVLDYDAVDAIVRPYAHSLKGRTLVNLTADAPGRARATAEWAAANGIGYLDGAIMVPTYLIGGPSALVLHSGPQELYDRHRDTLAAIGGTAVHLGSDPGRAASYDIALLDVFWHAMTGIVHAFALATAEGVEATALAPYAKGIADLLPEIIDSFAGQVDAGDFPAEGSNLRSAEATIAHILTTARARGLDASVIEAAHGLARRGLDAGYADHSYARLVEVVRG
ncbi:NAD(P)-dependent oxidoreductase [Kitasatospora sp. NPDC054939]